MAGGGLAFVVDFGDEKNVRRKKDKKPPKMDRRTGKGTVTVAEETDQVCILYC